MLSDHISQQLQANLKHTPTDSQKKAIDRLSVFLTQHTNDSIFVLKGYAGTGKTTLIGALVRLFGEMKMKSWLVAPTGRAAKVLSSYTNQQAYTIHKKIYRQKSTTDGFGKFILDKNLHKDTIFIVDEASMIANTSYELSIFGSGRLLEDLIEYVYTGTNCRMIIVGDTAQLPPVGINISPALDKRELASFGKEVCEEILTDVVRQNLDSGILFNATKLRNQISSTNQHNDKPQFSIKDFSDVIKIKGEDLIDAITDCYNKWGINETMVVCRSNKRANRYNAGIRSQILWREEEISVGDHLMVVKNNYFWLKNNEKTDFIANGDIVEIIAIRKYYERHGFRFADVSVRFLDYDDIEIDTRIIIDTLTLETASLPQEEQQKLFFSVAEDYQEECKTKKQKYTKVKEDPFFNALQVKFAYAVTCHKAQGGQWKNIFVDQGYITDDRIDIEYLRWLYTAFTRSVEKVYLVNFKDDYFEST